MITLDKQRIRKIKAGVGVSIPIVNGILTVNFTGSGGSGGLVDHNDLGGLNVGDYQHLTAAQDTDLTDGGNCSVHKHDDRYYTQGQVDDLTWDWSDLTSGVPTTIAGYGITNAYTKTEVDALTWDWSDIV